MQNVKNSTRNRSNMDPKNIQTFDADNHRQIARPRQHGEGQVKIEVLNGDCIEMMSSIPDKSINTCVTSPPYFGLRDYGHAGQIGLEDTPEAFVARLVEVFREVRRVLSDDGTLWLNIGDSYGKGKQQIGIPWRLALALQSDGWVLRQDVIWHKPNPMPESVRDRFTRSHEYIFLLTKGERYYFDAAAVKEPAVNTRMPGRKIKETRHYGDMNGGNTGLTSFIGKYHEQGLPTHRNRRSVWTVTTKPFKGAHFATFPTDLIEPCILAGCPKGGTVLDPFGGSGTTGVVAARLGRHATLIELNPEYAKIAGDRIAGEMDRLSAPTKTLQSELPLQI